MMHERDVAAGGHDVQMRLHRREGGDRVVDVTSDAGHMARRAPHLLLLGDLRPRFCSPMTNQKNAGRDVGVRDGTTSDGGVSPRLGFGPLWAGKRAGKHPDGASPVGRAPAGREAKGIIT